MNRQIREASPDDASTIAEFNSRLASETEGRPLDPELINPGVAAVVGQLLVTYEWSDWRNGMLWWIQSVYVQKDNRRKGVFSALYLHVESLARQEPEVCGLRLYVEKDNKRAQETYRKLGMVLPGYQVMEVDFRKNRGKQEDPAC